MPIMNITQDDPLNNLIEVYSILACATDKEEKIKFKCSCLIWFYISWCASDPKIEEDGSTLSNFIKDIRENSHVLDGIYPESLVLSCAMQADQNRNFFNDFRMKQILRIGQVLLQCYIHSQSGDNSFGMKKSVYLVSRMSEIGKMERITEKTLWAYWKENKPIAHMCCALALLADIAVRHDLLDTWMVEVGELSTGFINTSNIAFFISLSEQFRIFFENKKDSCSKRSLLEPGIAWVPPPHYQTEEINMEYFQYDVSDISKQIMEGYAKRHLP